ncbi:hypothetical protein I302_108449 [Kwoniella bestiolae CBS 10118]|uniref:Magnesium transporter NIPA2 n=1 Tax=Kwoniella bestiolae CBS 10118 TaxID=1296100 RepID=A0A1B9FVN3_9TREE|nr:hypothetical protein I302_07177 [Kwoniella bestiolae CBS 10118]OCF22832.1 hypothetical protein I302_07177 [Kwoniella bestiolae CBS 10118]
MSSSITSSATSSISASASAASGLIDKSRNPNFKIVGICLAVGSGLLIGSSFVIKKKGLLNSTKKYGNVAGEGHGYLKSWLWWAGMITMIVGEICNFVAYAFTEAILVTPMGALSVVVAAILSHFLLKEKLTFFGWIGCTLCIMGAVILALNAPEEQSVTTINEFKKLFLSVGFLVWASLLIAGSLVTIFFVAPRWGKKSMLPYISICSLIGGISVSCTQGLGASIVTSIQGNNQVKNWFFWFLFVFVVITLLTEINYLNKALELFNTSMVVPVYFCFFSSATLITSFILYQGLKASAVTLITMVLGFLVTCLGITLLQLSKVDPETLDTKLDRKSTILMQAAKHQTEDAEKGELTSAEDPGMDALRGGFGAVGSIIRARSVSRRMSTSSSGTGLGGGKGMYGYSTGNLSTHGLGHLERFQLSDNPMPADAMDQISLHSAKSPSALSPSGGFPHHHNQYFPSPQRSKSQLKASQNPFEYIPLDIITSPNIKFNSNSYKVLNSPLRRVSNSIATLSTLNTSISTSEKAQANDQILFSPLSKQFEEADVVHQYHYGSQPDDAAVHSYRPHPPPHSQGSIPPPSPSASASGMPTMGNRQPSSGSVYPVIEEADEEDISSKEKEKASSSRVYTNPVIVRDQAYLPNSNSDYLDPYTHPQPADLPTPQKLNPGHRGFSGLFHFPSGPDLSLGSHGRRSKSKDRSEKFPSTKKGEKDELDKQERTALVPSTSYDDEITYESDDDLDGDGRTTTENAHEAEAQIGVGHRVNLSTSTSTTATSDALPASSRTTTTFGTNPGDRSRESSSGSGSGPMGPRALPSKGRKDPPGFAGPRYGL